MIEPKVFFFRSQDKQKGQRNFRLLRQQTPPPQFAAAIHLLNKGAGNLLNALRSAGSQQCTTTTTRKRQKSSSKSK